MANSRLCSIPDCGKLSWSRGLCGVHYYKWQRDNFINGECIIDGCNRPVTARGLCFPHYKRKRRYGDPHGGGPERHNTKRPQPKGVLEQFLRETAIPYAGDDCLTWPFHNNTDGRGRVQINGRKTLAHRFVCEETNGPAPTPIHHAAHSCGNGHLGCVNPRHLRWATPTENEADKLIHGTRLRK